MSIAFAFDLFAFGDLFAFAGRLAFAFVLPFPFSLPFSFLFLGRRGLFSFAFAAFVLRFSLGSSTGVMVSELSPALVGRLMSMATV